MLTIRTLEIIRLFRYKLADAINNDETTITPIRKSEQDNKEVADAINNNEIKVKIVRKSEQKLPQ